MSPSQAQGGAYRGDNSDTRGLSTEVPALRIIWLVDGPYVATQPTESTMCRIVDGRAVHEPSVMVSRAIRPATRDEVMEWRVRA